MSGTTDVNIGAALAPMHKIYTHTKSRIVEQKDRTALYWNDRKDFKIIALVGILVLIWVIRENEDLSFLNGRRAAGKPSLF